MAGGTFAVAVIMVCMLGAGSVLLWAGIIGIIIFAISIKKRKSYGIPLTVVSSIVVLVSLVILAVPVGFFGFIIRMNSMPPDGYVETDIVIEEYGYQDTRFTADGVVYEVLELEFDYNTDYGEAVFSYEETGFMKGASYGNYFRVENPHGFDLVISDKHELFCPAVDKEDIYSFYIEEDSSVWFYENDDTDNPRPITNERGAAMNELSFSGLDEEVAVKVVLEDYEWINLYEYSSDKLIIKEFYSFMFVRDKVYLELDTEIVEDEICITGVEVPAESAEVLMGLRAKG